MKYFQFNYLWLYLSIILQIPQYTKNNIEKYDQMQKKIKHDKETNVISESLFVVYFWNFFFLIYIIYSNLNYSFQLMISMQDFLYPLEENVSLLRCYKTAVARNIIKPYSILYSIAKYHIYENEKIMEVKRENRLSNFYWRIKI